MTPAQHAWHALPEPWQACLEEAWDSWVAGSAGVGAVVTDGAGRIVVRERNRRMEATGPPGRAFGATVAHAEINACAALGTGRHPDHALWTSFEPCLMCAGAIRMTHIGRVVYATDDPVFDGMHGTLEELSWWRGRGPVVERLGGPFGTFAYLLHVSWIRASGAPDRVAAAHTELRREHYELAGEVAASGELRACRSVLDAVEVLWDRLG